VAALGVFALAGCSDEDEDTTTKELPLVALLADGQLVGGTTAGIRERVSLAESELRPVSRRLIAQVPGRRLLAVLVPRRREVVLVTLHGLRIRARIRLPADRGTRAAVVAAPEPDRVVVAGDRPTRAGGRMPVGWVVDVPSREVVARWQVPRAPDRNWTVLDAAAARDARRLYLTYHGGCGARRPRACTTGADVISWTDGRPLCEARASAGCIPEIHGEVAALDGGVVGTGGVPVVLRAAPNARVMRRWRSRLRRNHLMRLAYDETTRRIFTLGSCLYAGGLERIDLDGGPRWRRGYPTGGRRSLCGERVAAREGVVVLTKGPEGGGGESEITVVDAESGAVRGRLPVGAPVTDVLLVE
jgi:hypothetical protein